MPVPARAKLPLPGVCSCPRDMNREFNRSRPLSWSDITLRLRVERLIEQRVVSEPGQRNQPSPAPKQGQLHPSCHLLICCCCSWKLGCASLQTPILFGDKDRCFPQHTKISLDATGNFLEPPKHARTVSAS